MKKIYSVLTFLILVCMLLATTNPAKAVLTNKERNILANKAKEIDLAKSLITDNSWNKFPDYKNRAFWDKLPDNIRFL